MVHVKISLKSSSHILQPLDSIGLAKTSMSSETTWSVGLFSWINKFAFEAAKFVLKFN